MVTASGPDIMWGHTEGTLRVQLPDKDITGLSTEVSQTWGGGADINY